MQPNRKNRWGVLSAILVCVAFLVILIVFQSAAASSGPQPMTLKPPFAFHTIEDVSASGWKPLPPGSSNLLNEEFTSFNPTSSLTSTTAQWHMYNDLGSASFYWNRVTPLGSPIYSNTVWAACGTCDGSPGTSLNPNTNNYVPNMGTWLIYGPVDLRNYYTAEATFNYLLDANPATDGSGIGDFLAVGVSNDGTNFGGFPLTGNLTPGSLTGTVTLPLGWLTGTVNLANYGGRPSVYIGFYFHSNGDSSVGRGAFIDNVSVRAAPYLHTYMPVVDNNFSLATPIPTQPPYLYNFQWDSGQGENDPDFVQWGRSYSNKSGDTTIYEQGLTGGNPNTGMYLYNTQTFLTSMAGPNLTAPADFEIRVDFKVYKGKNNAHYGVVFEAGNSTFGRSGSTPTFDINTNYYKFGLQFPGAAGNVPADYRLERCDGNGSSCTKLVDRTQLPSGAAVTGVWDTITIRRQGATITVLVNGYQLISISDGTYTGQRKFGMYVQSADVNGTANPLEIDFDNYRVRQYP